MVNIKKMVIGIRPATKMFRLSTFGGQIIDTILSERGIKHIGEDYYSEVFRNSETTAYYITNKELGNTLKIELSDIIFIKDFKDSTTKLNYKKIINEFSQIWGSVNRILMVSDVRRIGMLTEHQIDCTQNNASKKLLEALTTFRKAKHPGKFRLKYEERFPTIEGVAPDIKKSDLINVIYDYYDSEADIDHPKSGALNANLDVQRYYSPLLKSKIIEEVKKLRSIFIKHKEKFDSFLEEKGLIVND